MHLTQSGETPEATGNCSYDCRTNIYFIAQSGNIKPKSFCHERCILKISMTLSISLIINIKNRLLSAACSILGWVFIIFLFNTENVIPKKLFWRFHIMCRLIEAVSDRSIRSLQHHNGVHCGSCLDKGIAVHKSVAFNTVLIKTIVENAL